jgi:spectinomycin phosphotransferase
MRGEYGINAVVTTPAKRGFYGETWKVEAVSKTSYFLKLVYTETHKTVYERSFQVIQHLNDHGVDYISRIIKIKAGKLSSCFDGAVLGVFDWINGDNTETDATKIPEYEMLARIYTVPAYGISIPREEFTSKHTDRFFEQWSELEDERVKALFDKHRTMLEKRAERLRKFAEICRNDITGFVITHGDAGGNFITGGEKNFIVDWDNPILAPPERDAWVMCSRDWAREAFENALRRNGIMHALRPERLAFYCYDFSFFYLTAFLDVSAKVEMIEGDSNDWIEERLEYANNIKI